MPRALVALGSNLGDRARLLNEAVRWLDELPHGQVLQSSAVRETAAVGGPPEQGAFLNAAAVLQTELTPRALFQALQELERRAGREPGLPWGPRPLDLDLLLYDDVVLNEPALTLPHPRLAVRRFVLEPAADVAPRWVHPLFRSTLSQLREHLRHAPPLVLLASTPEAAATELLAAAPARIGVAWHAVPRPAEAHEPLDEAAASASLEDVLRALAEGVWVVTDWRALASASATASQTRPPGPPPKAVVLWQEAAGPLAAPDEAFFQCVRETRGRPYLDLGRCPREEVVRQLLALVAGMQ